MSFLQERKESKLLLIYRYLSSRTQLSMKEQIYLENLEKGYQGELEFDHLLSKLTIPCLIINNLILEINHSTVQIDSLVLTPIKNYLFEVKNLEGDYIIDPKEDWYTTLHTPVKNPIHQLSRSEILFRQLLNHLCLPLAINPQIIFINPHFTLYKAPMNPQIIFPTQIDRFFEQLSKIPPSQKLSPNQEVLAKKLISIQVEEEYPFNKVPNYSFETIRKGIVCGHCHGLKHDCFDHHIVCQDCHHIESLTAAVLTSVNQYRVLFPESPMTVSSIQDWCGSNISQTAIRKILNTHFKSRGSSPKHYY